MAKAKTQKPTADSSAPRRANGEGSLYYYEDRNVYRGSVTVGYYPNGRPKRKTVQGSSPADVKKKIKVLLRMVEDGYTDPGNMTVGQWLDRYYTIYTEPRIQPKTKNLYTCLKNWLNGQLGSIKLAALQTYHVQQAINKIGETHAASSVKAAKIFLNAAMKRAVREALIRKNPVNDIKIAGHKTDKIRAASQEDIDILAGAWQEHRIGIIIPALLETGMRIGELLALDLNNDVTDKEIHVNKTVIEYAENHQRLVKIVPHTKTVEGDRIIPATPTFLYIVKILKQRRNEDKMRAGAIWQENNLLIAREDGRILPPTLCRPPLVAMCKRHGIPNITPHQLRHSYATRAVTAGVNPRVLQELLGHSDIGTTMKTYAEVEAKAKAEASEKITALAAGNAMQNSVASALHTTAFLGANAVKEHPLIQPSVGSAGTIF